MTAMTLRLRPRRQRGAVGVLSPILLIIFLAIGAMAIDIAHLFVVRNELQNAADAAALAGGAG
ncbi:pilus assembly protein TadG-related protein, partial [Ralstonia solanacearum]|uniref:pilus assembly protein TadG-related protein n=1 Tax=Ralstonia solanacearum TaxID=305 RepID=UPI001E4C37D8